MPRAVKHKVANNNANGGGRKKKKDAYSKPEKIPRGEILTDISKKQWKIGPVIGTGGFGDIYSACEAKSSPRTLDDYEYVVKIEPHENGPLFVEMHFYMRNAKLDDINKFCKQKGLKSLGMPYLIGSGSHEINGTKHRFIVMPRYGKDIWSYFLQNNKKLPEHTIYRLAIQMIDVYEYIHGCNYVHADLKGANILLGFGKKGSSQAYLVDFGLAGHFTTKAFKPDPKKMHNGTIEYTSRDAHNGVLTRRGDLEILAYNLVNWAGATLPWENNNLLNDPAKVQKEKEAFMTNSDKALEKLFQKIPGPIKEFFQYLTKLKYDDVPDYEKCRKIFLNGLKSLGKSNSGELDLKLQASGTSKPIKGKTSSDDFEEPVQKVKRGNKKEAIATLVRDEESDGIVSSPSPLKRQRARIWGAATPSKKTKQESSSTPDPPSTPPTINKNIKNERRTPSSVSPSKKKERKTNGTTTDSTKGHGSTIINDNTTPNPSVGKTYEFNFELDVSVDANVVVNVRRKKKANDSNTSNQNNEDDEGNSRNGTPVVRVRRVEEDTINPRRGRSKAK